MQLTKEQIFNILNKAIRHISTNFCEEDCDYVLEEQLREGHIPFDFSVEHGISKAVILVKGASYVFKLPFYCFYNEDAFEDACYEWRNNREELLAEAREKKVKETGDPDVLLTREEVWAVTETIDNDEPDGSDEYWYEPLEGATNINLKLSEEARDWNYCNLETEIYQEAVKRGLGAYFAEEGLLGMLDCGHPVYYQQRCTPLCNYDYDYSSDDYAVKSKKARTTCQKLEIDCFNPLWIADFIERYGEQELCHLHEFINEMEIGDLRDCNIGYLEGAPILFDYSGFRYWD